MKVAAYVRVSSKEQDQKDLSIPYQLDVIRKYCRDNNYTLAKEFVDAGKSAKSDERPAFQKMIALAKSKQHPFDVIIVHKIDRFSRNQEDHIIYRSLLRQFNVKIVSICEPYDEDTPHGFLSNGILQLISEFYNMNLAVEVMKGLTENAKRGYHNGGTPPYGYRIGKTKDLRGNEKSVWILGPDEEVETIKRIFDLYVHQGKGYKAIVKILNSESIPSPTGKMWSYTTINSILHNESYLGKRIWNKKNYENGKRKNPRDKWIITPNAHEPIIDKEIFEAVRTRGEERNPMKGPVKMFHKGISLFILRGMLKCHNCGANMVTGSNSKKASNYYRYYLCGTYARKGSPVCNRNPVNKEKIEGLVLETIINEFSILCLPGSLEAEIKNHTDYRNRDITFTISRIDSDLKHIQKKIELAKSEKKAAFITQYINELNTEIEKLETEKAELIKQLSIVDVDLSEIEILQDSLRNFINRIRIDPPDAQWNLLQQYIKSIIYDPYTGCYKLSYGIKRPVDDTVMLEKTIYSRKVN